MGDRAGVGGPYSPVEASGAGLTAVMARLGVEDLETLDTLIAAGIANSRAEAVRWTLARIRERPAYEQLRARTREIEDLKSQF
jgi:Arc/MetJ-type ribon-helix-helix transcriptional regulator